MFSADGERGTRQTVQSSGSKLPHGWAGAIDVTVSQRRGHKPVPCKGVSLVLCGTAAAILGTGTNLE